MVRKKLIYSIPVLVVIGVILFIILLTSKKSFSTILGVDESKITKVFMQDEFGNVVETYDKVKIHELINLLNNREYKKSKDECTRIAYTYYYDFYEGEKNVLRITGTGTSIVVNNEIYTVSREISQDAIAEWFQSLDEED